jgi:K+-sensing histidine kinase KdpD
MRRLDAVPHSGLFYLPGGIIGAIVLGMALAPLRELTNAGNFIFAFVILIMVVGELGGRAAAVATAACSALSLDFFLTKPYLSLKIEEKHDLIAFLGLALCGLVAAALGSRRGARGEGSPPPPR